MASSENRTLKRYTEISIEITKPTALAKLRQCFPKQNYTYTELVGLVHTVLRFDKGKIKRHENPLEIVAYGRGRCGEFAILYTALCLAYGIRARLILDLSDHVWTEVRIDGQWIHVDPTEKRVDDPYFYERDWKKDLKEIYAIENGAAENVTGKYKTRE